MIAHVQRGGGAVPALAYDAQTRGPVPIPPSERGLQAVVAEPWFKVSDEGLVLEGPAFDRDGDLLFCDVSGGRVLRLTPDKRLSTVVSLDKLAPGGLAIHKDGHVFIAAMDIADPASVAALLHPEWEEIGASGRRWSRDELLAEIAPLPSPVELELLATHRVSDDAQLIVWRSVGESSALRSSLWVRSGATWRQRFHQGTSEG